MDGFQHFNSSLHVFQNNFSDAHRSDRSPAAVPTTICPQFLHSHTFTSLFQILMPSLHFSAALCISLRGAFRSPPQDGILSKFRNPSLGSFRKTGIHFCPFIVLAFCRRFQVICRISDPVQFFKPHFACSFSLSAVSRNNAAICSYPSFFATDAKYVYLLRPPTLPRKRFLSFFVSVPAYLLPMLFTLSAPLKETAFPFLYPIITQSAYIKQLTFKCRILCQSFLYILLFLHRIINAPELNISKSNDKAAELVSPVFAPSVFSVSVFLSGISGCCGASVIHSLLVSLQHPIYSCRLFLPEY